MPLHETWPLQCHTTPALLLLYTRHSTLFLHFLGATFSFAFWTKNLAASLLVCILFTLSPHDVSKGQGMNLERPQARSSSNCGPKKAPKSQERSFSFSPETDFPGTTATTSRMSSLLCDRKPWHGAAFQRLHHLDPSCTPTRHLPNAVPRTPGTRLCSYRWPSPGSGFSCQSSTAAINLQLTVLML